MASNEDYLDKLLKNMENNEQEDGTEEEVTPTPSDIVSDMEEELPSDILSEVEEELPSDILSEVEGELPSDILPEVEGELPSDILSEVEGELPSDILSEVEGELPSDILSEVEGELPTDVFSDIVEELPSDILSDMEGEGELPSDIMPDTEEEGELPTDILSDIAEELPSDILSDIEGEELPTDILPDTEEEGELPTDILSDIAEELPSDILSDMEGEELPTDILPDTEEEGELPTDILSDIAEELPSDILSDMEGELPADILSDMEEELPADDTMSDIGAILGADGDFDVNDLTEQSLDSEDLLKEYLPEGILLDESELTEDLDTATDLGAVSGMSEDEIERILAASAEDSQEQTDESDIAVEEQDDEDLSGLLENSDDSDLLDIQDMLDKDENNEAVGEEIEALLHGAENPETISESETEDTKDSMSSRLQEKKRQRQEKAAAKKAAKAAAKEAKAAAKEAKAAAKAAAKQEKLSGESPEEPSEKTEEARPSDMLSMEDIDALLSGAEETAAADSEEAADSDDLFDTALLDSIVAEADQTGQDNEENFDAGDAGNLSGDLGDGNLSEPGAAMAEGSAVESDDALGFDIGSLFEDGDDSSLGLDSESASENDSAFPDFVDLNEASVDAAMQDLESGGKKKKGLLSRFFDMLTEEDEGEESESLHLSDENKKVLNDLDKEKSAKKKKKKVKKPASGKGEGDGEEDNKDGKAKKAKKVKKPKPEKPVKEPEPEPLIPERKLTLKRVMPVLLVCASLGVVLVVFANATVDYTDKQNAKEAYYAGDYQTCYDNLFGKDLNETEQIMFGTSESILYIRLWIREYEMFVEAGEEVEALDSLIQTVDHYPTLYAYAIQWNAGDEVMTGYSYILNILSEKYGLTEEQAKEIASVRSDYEYTKMVVAIVQGKPYGSWNEPVIVETEPEEPEQAPLPDELPEEGELEEGFYIGN